MISHLSARGCSPWLTMALVGEYLVQVGEVVLLLRRKTPLYGPLWNRSATFFLTCAKKQHT